VAKYTVGDLREMTAHLPTDAPVGLAYIVGDTEDASVSLEQIQVEDGKLVIDVEVYYPCEDCGEKDCVCDELDDDGDTDEGGFVDRR
jgi:hypothetical protein